MTWQTILYFSSIVLTCGLTGSLAWYAWKHRQVPGSSAYAWLALGEFILALTEILSVLSLSMDWALFWFQARYITGAFIAVFWLVFALEYSGRKGWLSKRLLAGLFIIPLITQILHWSNSLHGLWMKQEAGFYQNGPFWIADITSRLPGLGYLTHSFYTMLLTLAGIALMLQTAWRMRRAFIGQALLLAGAGLTALVFVINSLFHLLPEMEFNIFTPGIGLSVILIALAVFRFQFLKRAPAQESASRLTGFDAQENYSLAVFLLIFILFTSGLAAVSYLTYHNYEKQFRVQVERQLSAIAELKMSELVNWRAERMGDAEVLYKNPAFAALVQKSLENPDDAQAKAQLQAWLDITRNSYGYDRAFLLDTSGIEWLSSPTAPEPVAAHLKQQVAATLETGQVAFLDFHRDSPNGPIHLALLVPIFAEGDLNRPLGLLVLRIDPKVYLYPYINQWPTSSKTAETLLIRRDGEDVLFLNPLRFQPDAALNLRIPLDDTDILAVKAVLGQTGIVEGRDYRGEPVIGVAQAIPDSPWYMVARMDAAEVYAPLRERLWQTVLFFGVLIMAVGASLTLAWRRQRERHFRSQFEMLGALQASEEKFRLAFDTSPDSVAITRLADGMFVSVNKGFEQISGYTQQEIVGKTSLEINIWKDLEDRRKVIEELRTKGEVRNYEAAFLTRSGEIHGLMSAAIIKLNGEPHILNITRDITERKQVETALRESEEKFKYVFDYSVAGKSITLPSGEINANKAFCEMLGYSQEELKGGKWQEISHPDDMELTQKVINSLLSGEKESARFIKRYIHKNGSVVWADVGTALRCDKDGKPLYFMTTVNDITERRKAEEELRKSEAQYRLLAENMSDTVWLMDMNLKTVYISPSVVRLRGFALEEINSVPLDQQMTPESLQRAMMLFAEALSPENLSQPNPRIAYSIELEFHRKDGTSFWSENTFTLILDSNGQPVNILGSGRDITERKQTEEKLAWEQYLLSAMLDNSPDHIYFKDRHSRFTRMSNSLAEKFGLRNSAEMLGKTDFDFFTEAHARPAFDAEQNIIATGQPVIGLEEKETWPDGRVTWVNTIKMPLMDQAGNIIGTFGVSRDITERKRTEEKIHALSIRHEATLAAVPDILMEVNQDKVYTWANPSGFEFFGEDVIGKGADFYFEGEQDTYGAVEPLFDGSDEVIYVESWQRRKDGEKRLLAWRCRVLKDKDGNVTGALSSAHDITERKQAEEEIRKLNTELEQRVTERTAQLASANKELEAFAYSVSHDLRAPLRGIDGWSQALLEDYVSQLDQQGQEYIQRVRYETQHMGRLIDDLLQLSRITRAEMRQEKVNLSAIARSITARLKEAEPTRRVEVVIQKGLSAHGDPHLLEAALTNLLDNAFKFTGKRPAAKIEFGQAVVEGERAFFVRDNGAGFDMAYAGKLFGAFQRMHTTSEFPGTGIGLATVQRIIHRHGGGIWAASEAGQGATFYFTLEKNK